MLKLHLHLITILGKAKFPRSSWRFPRHYAKTVLFHKISTEGNYVKLRYFIQWRFLWINTFSTNVPIYFNVYQFPGANESECQKQPFADVLQNKYSQKFRNIHRKTIVLKSLFNKLEALINPFNANVYFWCFQGYRHGALG